MIILKKAEVSDKDKMWNIFQKYLYEMTNYYDMTMSESGNYKYRFFDDYFVESERIALFIYDDEILIGFIMINNYSCIGDSIDYAIAEFTIFPQYRKKHFGLRAIKKIFEQYHGKWEIKYSNQNKAAERFWIKATKRYTPSVSAHSDAESVLSFIVEKEYPKI